MHVSVKQKCFQFVLERVLRDVCRPQITWQTVPHSLSTDRKAAVTVTCPRPWDDACWQIVGLLFLLRLLLFIIFTKLWKHGLVSHSNSTSSIARNWGEGTTMSPLKLSTLLLPPPLIWGLYLTQVIQKSAEEVCWSVLSFQWRYYI